MYAAGNKNDGLRVYGDAFTRLYSSETDYSFAAFTAGMGRDRQYSSWHTSLGADIAAEFADGGLFPLMFYGRYSKSLYPDENRMTDAEDSWIVDKREDDKLLVTLRGEYMLTESLDAFAEYTGTDNDSNLPGYGYESSRIMFGLQKFF
ncbi:MAG: hypothetical protein ACLFMN_03400 [Desulfobacterales bacterium]